MSEQSLHMQPSSIHLLFFDPERQYAPAFRSILRPLGYQIEETRSEETALAAAQRLRPNLFFKPAMDQAKSRSTGLMERVRSISPDIQFLFVSPDVDLRLAMQAMRRGAFDCLPLPCEPPQLIESVQRALENQRLVAADPVILDRLKSRDAPNILVGDSPATQEVQDIIDRVACTDVTVLIQGESGTGKELVARALHGRSRRAGGPFIAVNCAALSDSIIESEWFGHVKGAFTGAIADKPGRFTLASGGTLFLDEIGDLSPKGQGDLLRVLEDGIYRPVGSARTLQADVRIVAASNRDLESLCAQGSFREDLLYRLNVITVRLAPLRERRGDIEPLATMFLRHFCARHHRPQKKLSSGLIRLLTSLDWPGNVRQLRNVIERMVLLVAERDLQPKHLPPHLLAGRGVQPHSIKLEDMTLADAELTLIHKAIERSGGNKAEAARRLGISRRTLFHRLAHSAAGGKPARRRRNE